MWISGSSSPSQRMGFALNLNRGLERAYKAMEKLSSGLHINTAADSPASLVISEQFRSSIAGLNQQIKNYEHLVHKYEYASAELSGMRSYLREIRTLAVAASNEALNSPPAQEALHDAASSLTESYNHRIESSRYNGRNLLDGSEGALAEIPELIGVDLSSASAASATIAKVDAALQKIDSADIEIGARQRHELESQIDSWQIARQNLIAAESSVRDTDYADIYSSFVGQMLISKANVALFAHMRTQESMWATLLQSK